MEVIIMQNIQGINLIINNFNGNYSNNRNYDNIF